MADNATKPENCPIRPGCVTSDGHLGKLQKEIQSTDNKLEENSQVFGNLSADLRSLADKLDQLKLENKNILDNYKTKLNSKVVEFKVRIERSKETKSSGSDIPNHDIESDSNVTQHLLHTLPLNMQANFDDLRKTLNKLTAPAFRKCKELKCKFCSHTETRHYFESSVDGKMYPIKDSMSCTSTNVIYLITCVKCKKQYVGRTEKELKKCFREHMKSSAQLLADKHFGDNADHSWDDMEVIAIEKHLEIDQLRPRKTHWIKELKTMSPNGLNKQK